MFELNIVYSHCIVSGNISSSCLYVYVNSFVYVFIVEKKVIDSDGLDSEGCNSEDDGEIEGKLRRDGLVEVL